MKNETITIRIISIDELIINPIITKSNISKTKHKHLTIFNNIFPFGETDKEHKKNITVNNNDA